MLEADVGVLVRLDIWYRGDAGLRLLRGKVLEY